MQAWLSKELLEETREIFEPRYGRGLSEEELVEIAENLATFTEHVLKNKWKKYGNVYARPRIS